MKNTPITKEQIYFRSINHKIYTVSSNKTANCNPNENDEEILDKAGIMTHPDWSNIPFIKYFDDKDIKINHIEKLKRNITKFIENDKLWWCCRRKRKRT